MTRTLIISTFSLYLNTNMTLPSRPPLTTLSPNPVAYLYRLHRNRNAQGRTVGEIPARDGTTRTAEGRRGEGLLDGAPSTGRRSGGRSDI